MSANQCWSQRHVVQGQGLDPQDQDQGHEFKTPSHSKYIIVIIEQIEGNKYCKYKTAHKA